MTREEAISRINNDLEWHKKELSAAYKTALNMAIEALKFCEVYDKTIEAVNKFYDEHHAQILSWTPCSERLPNEEENVLVTDDDGTIYIAYYTTICDEPCWTWAGWSLHPKAWMQLPTPYIDTTPQSDEEQEEMK